MSFKVDIANIRLELEKALGAPLGETWRPGDEWGLVADGKLTEQDTLKAYVAATGLESPEDEIGRPERFDGIPTEYLAETLQLPISWDDTTVTLAVAQPWQLGSIALHWRAGHGRKARFVLVRRSQLERRLAEVYQQRGGLDALGGDDSEQSLRDIAKEAPIVRLVNDIFARALESGASDIHIEPSETELKVRFRIDGVLSTAFEPPHAQYSAIASRLKLIGGLNISERRLPQDGRIQLTIGREDLDVRMSTLPAIHGESIVMRLLRKNAGDYSFTSIGMDESTRGTFEDLIQRPHGLILVVGPTGSGKTTTLYCALMKLNTGLDKIITVEDPVEYQVPGITQVQVKSSIGLTFSSGLRSIVRQDPDIILVGEIRDRETADICINAALTGHLVLSTLHTNDSAGAISRLQDMGVEPFLIASALTGVMSQRLVRRVCPVCRSSGLLGDLRCRSCSGTGYKGRVGIYELLVIDDAIRSLITRRESASIIAKHAQANNGLKLVREDGLAKVTSGLTTLEEVERVCCES